MVSEGQTGNWVFRGAKRAVDLAFALTVVLLLWWLLILVWIGVKLQSPGPGLFTQVRVGRDGELFKCYKFRTMKLGTAEAATHEVRATAVTSLGRLLRATKLDELPQIINIILNQVSLVGPRPCLPIQVDLIDARRANGSLKLKPGITGLGQVNRIDMSNPARLAGYDICYGQLQSLLLDLRIIVDTALGRGRGDNVG
ncbi:hypothetical protein ASD80_13210 [Devosia sp. Root635]|nr:hypothetical protein ASD80_13210 [Devosia sp. Root635]